jgi:hypothetical protein
MTSITISDPALLAKLDVAALAEGVELRDPTGKVLGTVTLDGYGKPPPGYKIPFTDDELAEFAKQKTGRPLADIMRDLREKYGA